MDLEQIHQTARAVALSGGEVAMRWFRNRDLEIQLKADESPVTAADRTTEETMREMILRAYPDHGILGEEHGGSLDSAGPLWVVDPIDGTKTFIRGVPLFTTLVAFLLDGIPQVGVIHAPATGETVSAWLGGGAWDETMNRVHVSADRPLNEAWFGTTDPSDLFRRHPEFTKKMLQECEATRTWADGYGYMLLARGDLDIMVDPIMAPWDIAPLGVVVREAGGVFTNFAGGEEAMGCSGIAVASAGLHRRVMACLGAAPRS